MTSSTQSSGATAFTFDSPSSRFYNPHDAQLIEETTTVDVSSDAAAVPAAALAQTPPGKSHDHSSHDHGSDDDDDDASATTDSSVATTTTTTTTSLLLFDDGNNRAGCDASSTRDTGCYSRAVKCVGGGRAARAVVFVPAAACRPARITRRPHPLGPPVEREKRTRGKKKHASRAPRPGPPPAPLARKERIFFFKSGSRHLARRPSPTRQVHARL